MGSGQRLFDAMSFLDEGFGESPRPRALGLYYAVKPFVPAWLRLAARRVYARRQATRKFPAWPIEPLLVNRLEDRLRSALAESASPQVPFVNFWPDGRRFAVILTHDLEGPAGIENIPRVLEVERRHGMVSSWNFVAEDYPIERSVFPSLIDAGCEIGLHGISHDCALFSSRAEFERQLPAIRRYLREWRVAGFRSPATHRNAEWMSELGCLYDSSFPDTDPFEPQPGGCCSIWPYFLGDVVELPLTLTQDHTIFEILRQDSIDLWVQKSEWIMANHGLINVLVHPDYVLREDRLAIYDQFLAWLSAQGGGWHALPHEVASWWRARAAIERGSGDAAEGDEPWAARATVALASERQGGIVIDTGPS